MNIIVIPVSKGSLRLPRKALLLKRGKPLLRYTYEAACKARLFDRIIIATDDRDVEATARLWGCEVVVSKGRHKNGTRRVAEAVDRVANLDAVCESVSKTKTVSTLCSGFGIDTERNDKNKVKALVSKAGRALYFTRENLAGAWHHIGVYGFTVGQLERISNMPPSALSEAEGLEQLEWMDNGMEVSVLRVDNPTVAINTAEDWKKWEPPEEVNPVFI